MLYLRWVSFCLFVVFFVWQLSCQQESCFVDVVFTYISKSFVYLFLYLILLMPYVGLWSLFVVLHCHVYSSCGFFCAVSILAIILPVKRFTDSLLLDLDARNPVFGICDPVHFKPACSAVKTSYDSETLSAASLL